MVGPRLIFLGLQSATVYTVLTSPRSIIFRWLRCNCIINSKSPWAILYVAVATYVHHHHSFHLTLGTLIPTTPIPTILIWTTVLPYRYQPSAYTGPLLYLAYLHCPFIYLPSLYRLLPYRTHVSSIPTILHFYTGPLLYPALLYKYQVTTTPANLITVISVPTTSTRTTRIPNHF